MKMKCILAVLAAMFSLAVPAHAEPKVTVDATNKPVVAVLQQLFKSIHASDIIAQDVTGNVTVNMQDVPFSKALDYVLKADNLTCTLNDGVYVVSRYVQADVTQPEIQTVPVPVYEPVPTYPDYPYYSEPYYNPYVNIYPNVIIGGWSGWYRTDHRGDHRFNDNRFGNHPPLNNHPVFNNPPRRPISPPRHR